MTDPHSTLLEDVLAEFGTPFGERASEHPCEGSRFHSPQPLTTQQVGIGARDVYLCPTCSAKVQVFLHLAQTMPPDKFTWPVQREFGNAIRALGHEQIAAWTAPPSDGDSHV